MKIYTVKRRRNGLSFLLDEDRIKARSWIYAEIKLFIGKLTGRYDASCHIDGMLVEEIPVSVDNMLDIMIMIKTIKL
ncbi:hypothetical protein [Dysgonomonas termitidis]|uniref:Uncharacterized protein n=1 Tax=Dysgonomonas termitidis TaxID=1516126 RepID=A0ABV9L1F6_9BACT